MVLAFASPRQINNYEKVCNDTHADDFDDSYN